MGPSRKRIPQACDRCRVKKAKCDVQKPVCTRCALDRQMCTFSERKFPKDRVIPKGYVELLENRVKILETGLREALLRLNASGGFRLPHSPSSNPQSPTSNNSLDDYNITQALKELQAMKVEREKGISSDVDRDNHGDHGDSRPRGNSAESPRTTKIEDLVSPSPPPKAQFLPADLSQLTMQPKFADSNLNPDEECYDQHSNSVPHNPTGGLFMYDGQNLSWLDLVP